MWSLDAVTRYNLQVFTKRLKLFPQHFDFPIIPVVNNIFFILQKGHVEDLPAMNQGRYWHGCGSYNQPDGTVVSLHITAELCLL